MELFCLGYEGLARACLILFGVIIIVIGVVIASIVHVLKMHSDDKKPTRLSDEETEEEIGTKKLSGFSFFAAGALMLTTFALVPVGLLFLLFQKFVIGSTCLIMAVILFFICRLF